MTSELSIYSGAQPSVYFRFILLKDKTKNYLM